MNRQHDFGKSINEREQNGEAEVSDRELEAVLRDFRSTVHSWSDATQSAPRLVLNQAPQRVIWRRSVVWACSLTLAAGLAGTGLYERHHQQAVAAQQKQMEIEHQHQVAAQQAKEEDDLLAKVNQDLSQDVPDAMQPLAGLSDDGTQ